MCTSVCFVIAFVSDLQLNTHLHFAVAPSIIVVIVTTNCCPNLVLVATITSLSPSCVFQPRLLVSWLVYSSDDCILHETLRYEQQNQFVLLLL